jgi:hypothetical protein
MNKEEIIYTENDFVVFKDKPTSDYALGNCVGKTLKEIEKIKGKEIKKVYRYVTRKKTIYRSDKDE